MLCVVREADGRPDIRGPYNPLRATHSCDTARIHQGKKLVYFLLSAPHPHILASLHARLCGLFRSPDGLYTLTHTHSGVSGIKDYEWAPTTVVL